MARQPRLDVPGVAQHVIQRGNDRQACFASTADHARYRQELLEASLRFGCSVHSYVLMTNHVHILVTPAERGAVSRMMQAIGCWNVGTSTRESWLSWFRSHRAGDRSYGSCEEQDG